MKYACIIICCSFLFSCNGPFINHKLKVERVGDCAGISNSIKIIKNINGTRYDFFSCLNEGFDGKNYSVIRKGDSLIVDFPEVTTQNKAAFRLILDVDAKPAYEHIIIGGREVNFTSSEQ